MIAKHYRKNPVLIPSENNSWEKEGTFNGCPLKENNKIKLFYRAISSSQDIGNVKINLSTIGYAESSFSGFFKNRKLLIQPENDWEKYGCEDPRVVKIGKNYYIFYTALSQYPFVPEGIKVALAKTKDFKNFEKHLVTPFNAKAMTLFPQKIKGKWVAVLSVDTDRANSSKIGVAFFSKETDIWSNDFWNNWYQNLEKNLLPIPRNQADHFEVGAPPIKIKEGWLFIYSYIRNYFDSKKENLFEIQAVILSAKDPFKMIGQSKTPLLVPEKEYELYGKISGVIFPSGAFLKKNELHLFYGGADSVCCAVKYNLKDLTDDLIAENSNNYSLKRYKKNPILKPKPENGWEARSTINAGAIYEGGKTHLLYRAEANNFVSVIGYACSKNGYSIDERFEEPIYVPRYDFEKNDKGQFYGCEDPRLVRIGSMIYMFYTAFNGIQNPRVALTSIKKSDFLKRRWNWSPAYLISDSPHSNKDTCIFPEKFKGKYLAIHRVDDYGMSLQYFDSLDFSKTRLNSENNWISPRKGKWDSRKVGLNGPPIKTKWGWLILYHGISEFDSKYRFGAILTELKKPENIIARTEDPIFEPIMDYEKEGNVSNVVFSCGNVLIGKTIFVYYGGADKILGVATTSLSKLIKEIKKSVEY
ncbi:MAG: hypothetical protein COT31_04035 [Candidatus Moranbacteria bacterium CG08_land_8_20_14_0_20_34_16]|nr:MAG: hypothetical protein COT31_04035 [Candidatus Moranbacteria bacterium CG08_land_8_20_14_0_20_34_16]